jgi:hypothetical protein
MLVERVGVFEKDMDRKIKTAIFEPRHDLMQTLVRLNLKIDWLDVPYRSPIRPGKKEGTRTTVERQTSINGFAVYGRHEHTADHCRRAQTGHAALIRLPPNPSQQ